MACCTLAALKQPITLLLQLQPDVLHEATPYWWIRVGITPLVLLNMTLSGILQVSLQSPPHQHHDSLQHVHCCLIMAWSLV